MSGGTGKCQGWERVEQTCWGCQQWGGVKTGATQLSQSVTIEIRGGCGKLGSSLCSSKAMEHKVMVITALRNADLGKEKEKSSTHLQIQKAKS